MSDRLCAGHGLTGLGGVAPDQLDSVILKLDERFEKEFVSFDGNVTKAEVAIKPFLEG